MLAPQSERTGLPVKADWAAKPDLGPMPESVEPAVSVAVVVLVEGVATLQVVGQADRVAQAAAEPAAAVFSN